MLAGKQFKRGVRGITLAYEAMLELYLTAFFAWCSKRSIVIPEEELCQKLHLAQHTFESPEISTRVDDLTALSKLITENVQPILQRFRQKESNISKTFSFWCMFMDAVDIMLKNIHAERTGSWDDHLSSLVNMLPYMFATDKMNYSRWLPVYILT